MLLAVIFGTIQIVVALSAWDCSTGVKVVVGIGAGQAGIGLVFTFVRMVQAKMSGVGLLAVFTMETFVLVQVNEEGRILGVGVADAETTQVARGQLARGENGQVQQIRG